MKIEKARLEAGLDVLQLQKEADAAIANVDDNGVCCCSAQHPCEVVERYPTKHRAEIE